MPIKRTLITNATLVNEGSVFEADLLIEAGRIARIDREIPAPDNATVVDAEGAHLLPGMIDDQVHFRDPGAPHKGSIRSESRAAIAGGVTSFMDMPNTNPTTTTHAALEDKHAVAARDAAANWGFYFGATNDNLDAIRTVDPARVCGVKVFMGASTGNMLVDNEQTLAGIFRDTPLVIATHCENSPMIEANYRAALEEFGPAIPVTEHPKIRSAEACYASTELAVSLALEYDANLHVLHLTTARELDFFAPGPIEDKRITAETCIHFLHFTDADFETLGNRIKCNPSIKTEADRDALRAAVREGRIDILATDHAPHTTEEKASEDYLKAPAGLPLVQDVLVASLDLALDGHFDLPTLVTRAMHNPAIRFGVRERGFLREGYWADLVLVDLVSSTRVTPGRCLYHVGWSPFEGRSFNSRVVGTWVNGALAFDGKKVLEHGNAQALEYERS
jgi:dihydroorotase